MAEAKKTTKEQETTNELLKFTENFQNIQQYATAVDNILKLVDLSSSSTKTWTVFNKDNLRSYLQSPYSSNSQANLRNLARFLYTLSFPLRRIVNYFASLPDFSAYKVNLDFSLIEENDEESLLQDSNAFQYFSLRVKVYFQLILKNSDKSLPFCPPYQT